MVKKIIIGIFGVIFVVFVCFIGFIVVYPIIIQKIYPIPKKTSYNNYYDLNGKKVNLSKAKGKQLVLVFFTSGCSFCNEEIPKWSKYYKVADSSKIKIYGVLSSSRKEAKRVVKEKNISFPVILDEQGEISNKYGIIGYPWIIVADEQGKITSSDSLYDNMKSYLKKYLKGS